MGLGELLTFESAFDEYTSVPDKRLFKDSIITKMATEGTLVQELPDDGSGDLLLKTIDPHVSQGYNVFKKPEDYQEWMQRELQNPSLDEVVANLKEQDGTGA